MDAWSGVVLGAGGGLPVALGGSLAEENLLGACRRGFLCEPTADEERIAQNRIIYAIDVADGAIPVLRGTADPYSILWWSPTTRFVIPVDSIRVNRSLRRRLRGTSWTTTVDHAFGDVLRSCRDNRDQEWLTDEYVRSLMSLHAAGAVHSVEVWEDDRLIGGLFGWFFSKVFVLESAFHRMPDAGKVAFVDIAERAARIGAAVLDMQVRSDYTVALGAVEMPREEYLRLLADGAHSQHISTARQSASRLVKGNAV